MITAEDVRKLGSASLDAAEIINRRADISDRSAATALGFDLQTALSGLIMAALDRGMDWTDVMQSIGCACGVAIASAHQTHSARDRLADEIETGAQRGIASVAEIQSRK
jgi:hypothetical protein